MLDIYRICGPKCIEFVVQGKPTSARTKKIIGSQKFTHNYE